MPTEAERRKEMAWQAQQAALELETRQKQELEKTRKEDAERKKREELQTAAAAAMAKIQGGDDTIGRPRGEAEEHSRGDAGDFYCGRVYVSRLVDFDDPEQAFSVDIPGEQVRYSISWGCVPSELRNILKEYRSVGGTITARTQTDWINDVDYKLWVSLYLS
jgi:hypothetical protein